MEDRGSHDAPGSAVLRTGDRLVWWNRLNEREWSTAARILFIVNAMNGIRVWCLCSRAESRQAVSEARKAVALVGFTNRQPTNRPGSQFGWQQVRHGSVWTIRDDINYLGRLFEYTLRMSTPSPVLCITSIELDHGNVVPGPYRNRSRLWSESTNQMLHLLLLAGRPSVNWRLPWWYPRVAFKCWYVYRV